VSEVDELRCPVPFAFPEVASMNGRVRAVRPGADFPKIRCDAPGAPGPTWSSGGELVNQFSAGLGQELRIGHKAWLSIGRATTPRRSVGGLARILCASRVWIPISIATSITTRLIRLIQTEPIKNALVTTFLWDP